MRTNGDHTEDPTTDHTDVPTDALTVAEAAEILGITTEAARMRVKRGTLPSTRIDGTVYVLVDQTNPRPNGPSAGPNDKPNARPNRSVGGPNGQPDAAGALLAAKDETIEALRDQLEAERSANRENRRIIAGLIERVPALEASQNGPEGAQGPPSKPGGVQDREEPEGRSWWRRVFGG
jgi:excisionase family DNA binding protein